MVIFYNDGGRGCYGWGDPHPKDKLSNGVIRGKDKKEIGH
jgi:hypothetical protein